MTTIKIKNTLMENFFIKPIILRETAGKKRRISIPSIKGSASIKKIVESISQIPMLKELIKLAVGLYIEAQIIVLNGVIKIAATVEMADMLIDNGVLPFAK